MRITHIQILETKLHLPYYGYMHVVPYSDQLIHKFKSMFIIPFPTN